MKLKELTEYFQENLYEMSTYLDRNTGLPTGTKLWVRTEPKALQHVKYHIKISHPQKGSAVFALWGDEAKQVTGDWEVTGKDLTKIQTLVALTQKDLISHIDGTTDSADLTFALQRVKPQVEQI
ncbi:MAG: hypothetical protein ACREAU_07720 [Nitrosopumilaceae archaeon]